MDVVRCRATACGEYTALIPTCSGERTIITKDPPPVTPQALLIVTVFVPGLNDAVYWRRAISAGPSMTAPVEGLNRDPWVSHCSAPLSSEFTAPCWCVHTLVKARNCSLPRFTTM